MWHEARKQERLLRSMMVDYRKRAERRREYYEKTKGDPAQFLQIHGRPMKIHIDPAIAAAADSPATMMPWQGQPDILIDRFDVRAHLDFILPRPKSEDSDSSGGSSEELWEDRQANYERYRILVQNEFIGVSEEKFLHQIAIEEQFGPVQKLGEEEKKKMLAPKKAAIGFTYDDSTSSAASSTLPSVVPTEAMEEEESDSDIDLDLSIAVDKLTTEQMHELNKCALHFGLGKQDFMSLLTHDLDEQENMRVAKEEEQERAMYSGRKARKERRAFRERKLQALLQSRCLSPPSYAARSSPTYGNYRRSSSPSKSRSPSPCEGGITFITSFGGDDSDQEAKTTSIAKKREKDVPSKKTLSSNEKLGRQNSSERRSTSRDRSNKVRDRRSRSRSRDKRSRSRSRERSFRAKEDRSSRERRMRRRSHSGSHRRLETHSSSHRRSRSREYRRSYRRSRSHSRSSSRSKRSRRSRSRSRSRWHSKKHSPERARKRSSSSSSSSSLSGSRSSRRSPSASSTSSSSPSPPPPPPPPAPPLRESSPPLLPAPPVRRYYGRKKSDSDSSLSDNETPLPKTAFPTSNTTTKSTVPLVSGSSVGTSAGTTKNTLTPQERLKRKMQAALNKQYKADKKAEKEKLLKAEQERLSREEEMRELALRLRRKERQRRHAMLDESGSSSQYSRSPSRSRSSTPS